ncbi:hypothetical protein EYE42_07125 [Paracoccus subflavus]|uniref:ATP-sulfurylase PUA-like domain-containing protein n=1 Tax=Paracoccus subflavus TaxID=2528244 RepID=A0A4Q9G127_9RHOB|nr:hypothetical protein [Paracoccus subflavus]TBN41145.1 hypothetical protein EYE42_07125 [Paracoccus subflavus]
MIPAHHRPIPELFVSPDAIRALQEDAARLPAWTMDQGQADELALLLTGGCAPLRGYMTQIQHDEVVGGAVLPWPAPLVLTVGDDLGNQVSPGEDIALRDRGGRVLAVMSVTDRWRTGPVRLGGRVKGLRRPDHPGPNGMRALWRARNAARVLSVQPGDAGDIGAAAGLARRLDAALLIQPFPGVHIDLPDDAVIAPLPIAPPEGPHRLLWQGAVARNFGATHLLVENDPAGRDLLDRHRAAIGVRAVMPADMA